VKDGLASRFCATVRGILDEIAESQWAALNVAGQRVADTVEQGNLVYTFGSGHSSLVAAEPYGRAGSLANLDVIVDKTFGRAERLPGYAKILLDAYPITAKDLLIVISNSGRNAVPAEMAIEARNRGIYTIGISALRHSRAVAPRNAHGLRLFEVCDLVIDNCGLPGDASVEIPRMKGLAVGPTSTLGGVFIVNLIICIATEALCDRQKAPPVLVSANLDQGDAWNSALIRFLRERTRGL
jgi:uncharacterized phosphosugar-binding protein